MIVIYVITLCFGLGTIVHGNHFLGGTISWRPLNKTATGSPVAIVITQTYSWAYTLVPCTQATIASNSYVPSYASLSARVLECIYNCATGAIGYPNISVIPRCTDFSVAAGITMGQRLDTVYLDINDDFAAAFRDYSWRPLATDTNAGWAIGTRIIVKPRSDTGYFNSAPVATVMSPINIPYNKTIRIVIPVADADSDFIRCRWANKSNGINECRDVCPPNSLPPHSMIYPNCTIIITGRNLSDWYAVAITVEDFINSSSTTALSSVPVQFLVYVISASSCSALPEIIGLPLEQSCMPIRVGQTLISQLKAQNNCGPNVTIVDISTLSFAGMIASNITKENSTIYYKTLTWTPTIAQLGYQLMCAMAFDSENAQSAQYCFKFYVSQNELCSCPGENCSITTTKTKLKDQTGTWILTGILIGLVLLAVITLCCCFYHYKLCLFAGRVLGCKQKESVEFYHIDRCIDLNCVSNKKIKKRNAIPIFHRNCSEQNVIIQRVKNFTELPGTRSQVITYRTDSYSIFSKKDNTIYIPNNSSVLQSKSSNSVAKIKIDGKKSRQINPIIKQSNRLPIE
ncbi:hypothetical protein I4U23_011917 [Adineta vaga]|nr:hypothetical protein I4U23_011917 [Adineta vaga]